VRRPFQLAVLTVLLVTGFVAAPAAAQPPVVESCTLTTDRSVVRPGETVSTTITVDPSPSVGVITVLVDDALVDTEGEDVATGPFLSFSSDQLAAGVGPEGTMRIEVRGSPGDTAVLCSVEFSWTQQPAPTTTTPSTTTPPAPDPVAVPPAYTG
jgi:hypothetical protein